jgi:dGTPase
VEWAQLISSARFKAPAEAEPQRSPFQRDSDRIVFSAAFRRLQDKTQVHPFPDSDYVRRRLTHSLEVSCVGRSLGTELGNCLVKKHPTLISDVPEKATLAFDLGQIVANACLAHDIGNPPFGHAGEKAIGSWFKEQLPSTLDRDLTEVQRADLHKFEGNAQGFRLLTRLQDFRGEGGMRLTYATLATFTKYPTSSVKTGGGYVGAKKHGFFADDVKHFAEIAKGIGLTKYKHGWRRHPLVFLMEAADDICYRVIDVEDAFKLNRLSFNEAEDLLRAIFPSVRSYSPEWDEGDTISWLRAKAIGVLIKQVCEIVEAKLSALMAGEFSKPLIESIAAGPAVEAAYNTVKKRVFAWERTVSAEIAGAQMITDVLERLIYAVESPTSYKNGMLLKIVPHYKDDASTYAKILTITDFVAGMTDTYLQRIHRRVTGHAIL